MKSETSEVPSSNIPCETRHQFFVRRLKELGMYDKDSDYDGMIGKAVEGLSFTFQQQGHSGGSASITLYLFSKLMQEWQSWPIQ